MFPFNRKPGLKNGLNGHAPPNREAVRKKLKHLQKELTATCAAMATGESELADLAWEEELGEPHHAS